MAESSGVFKTKCSSFLNSLIAEFSVGEPSLFNCAILQNGIPAKDFKEKIKSNVQKNLFLSFAPFINHLTKNMVCHH